MRKILTLSTFKNILKLKIYISYHTITNGVFALIYLKKGNTQSISYNRFITISYGQFLQKNRFDSSHLQPYIYCHQMIMVLSKLKLH